MRRAKDHLPAACCPLDISRHDASTRWLRAVHCSIWEEREWVVWTGAARHAAEVLVYREPASTLE